jgi:hypothetical protein
VSLLPVHLVFVTKYRRPLFTDEMLTFGEHTMRAVCSEFDVAVVASPADAHRCRTSSSTLTASPGPLTIGLRPATNGMSPPSDQGPWLRKHDCQPR